MATQNYNELRLRVMMSIHHPEDYYKQGLISKGLNPEELTHDQIASWKAAIKAVEADILIELANTLPIKTSDTIDMSIFTQFINTDSEK